MRLDQYLAQYWPEHSRSTWQKYVRSGFVRVNDEIESSPKRTLGEDDEVVPFIPDVEMVGIDPPILHEDDNVVVINKPVGMLVHPRGKIREEFTVLDFLEPRMNDTDDDDVRPGIVHRLDRDTSGVMICAKNAATKKLLQRQFQDRKVKKTYLAIVKGTPKLSEATIDVPIGRDPKQPSRFRAYAGGKSAQTAYRVLASSRTFSVVECKPVTGRTHQLRVHLAHIGCPIVGDRFYGDGKSPIGRLGLHAKSLEVTIPSGDRRTFDANPPADFADLMKELGA